MTSHALYIARQSRMNTLLYEMEGLWSEWEALGDARLPYTRRQDLRRLGERLLAEADRQDVHQESERLHQRRYGNV